MIQAGSEHSIVTKIEPKSEEEAQKPDAACGEEPPLGRALFRVSRALFFEEKPIPELIALPMAQLRLLWTVRFSPDATMKDCSERLSVSQSTVTQLADQLVKRGFVERLADVNDRRVVRLRVSSFGQEVMERADAQRKQILTAVWEALTPQEQAEVICGLEILGRAGEAVREAQGHPMPPLPDKFSRPAETAAQTGDSSQAQPVVDLMARRVRGQ